MGVYTWPTSIVNAEYLTLGGGGFSYPLFSLPCGCHFKVLTLLEIYKWTKLLNIWMGAQFKEIILLKMIYGCRKYRGPY